MSVSGLQGSGKESNIPGSVSPQSDTVGALIERVEVAINSKGAFTDEQLNDIDLFLDLTMKYRKVLELEQQSRVQQNANPNFGPVVDSLAKTPAPQAEIVSTGNPVSPKSNANVPNISSSTGANEQKEGTRSLETERFEKQAQEFNQISTDELQSHLDWMKDNEINQPTKADQISSSSTFSKVKQGFWNALSYIYPTKK